MIHLATCFYVSGPATLVWWQSRRIRVNVQTTKSNGQAECIISYFKLWMTSKKNIANCPKISSILHILHTSFSSETIFLPTIAWNPICTRHQIHVLLCIAFSPRQLGLYSRSGMTSYRQISWSLDAARLSVAIIVSVWKLKNKSTVLLLRCLSNFRAIGKV